MRHALQAAHSSGKSTFIILDDCQRQKIELIRNAVREIELFVFQCCFVELRLQIVEDRLVDKIRDRAVVDQNLKLVLDLLCYVERIELIVDVFLQRDIIRAELDLLCNDFFQLLQNEIKIQIVKIAVREIFKNSHDCISINKLINRNDF